MMEFEKLHGFITDLVTRTIELRNDYAKLQGIVSVYATQDDLPSEDIKKLFDDLEEAYDELESLVRL